jgi:hypothetical protein
MDSGSQKNLRGKFARRLPALYSRLGRRRDVRRLFVLAVLLAATALTAAANAARPDIQPAPALLPFPDTTCGFVVTVTLVSGETAKTFSDGSTIVSGSLTVEFSANGKSVSRHIAGPVFISPGGTIIGRGVGGGPLITPEGTILGFAAGPALVTPSGASTLQHGTILLDVCAALAA